MYREEFKQELAPLFSEITIHHFIKVIETYKERGDLIEKPTPIHLRMLLTFLYGYFTSRRFSFRLEIDNLRTAIKMIAALAILAIHSG